MFCIFFQGLLLQKWKESVVNLILIVDSPSLEIFKTRLDKVLCSLLVGDPAWAGGWAGWPTEVPSNPEHSVVLKYSRKQRRKAFSSFWIQRIFTTHYQKLKTIWKATSIGHLPVPFPTPHPIQVLDLLKHLKRGKKECHRSSWQSQRLLTTAKHSLSSPCDFTDKAYARMMSYQKRDGRKR